MYKTTKSSDKGLTGRQWSPPHSSSLKMSAAAGVPHDACRRIRSRHRRQTSFDYQGREEAPGPRPTGPSRRGLECLRLAIQAPTGTNLQTWRWLVVTDPEVRQRIGALYRGPRLGSASVPPGPAASEDPEYGRMMESVSSLLEHLPQYRPRDPLRRGRRRRGGLGAIHLPPVWSFMLALWPAASDPCSRPPPLPAGRGRPAARCA